MKLLTKKALLKLNKDPILSHVINKYDPIYQAGSNNVFNELIKNITYQQISYKAAEKIYANFISIIGQPSYTPSDILKTDYDVIKSAGFSYRKTDYIINISTFFENRNLYHKNWETLSNNEITNLLTKIKGVGIWTVQMILIFELQRADVFPSLDLAIQQAIKEIYTLNSEKKQLIKDIEKISQSWIPHRTLASLYLWSFRRAQIEANKKK